MFPRTLYAASNSSVLFVCAALMAFLFDLAALVDLMSIGTLLAYTLVAVCVLILRYQPGTLGVSEKLVDSVDELGQESAGETRPLRERFTAKLLLVPSCDVPTGTSGLIVYVTTAVISALFTLLCVVLAVWGADVMSGHPVWVTISVTLVILSAVCVVILWRQPPSRQALTFKVPLLPVLPLVSIFVNVYLMMQLDGPTWCRFAVWMAIGFLIYFGYGMKNSSEASPNRGKLEPVLNKRPIYLAVDDSELEETMP